MSSSVVTCDKQGRISIIPPQHKEYAGLIRDVIIVGVMDTGLRYGIYNAGMNAEADNGQNYENDAEDLFRLGSVSKFITR